MSLEYRDDLRAADERLALRDLAEPRVRIASATLAEAVERIAERAELAEKEEAPSASRSVVR